jgi:hypothetical protein
MKCRKENFFWRGWDVDLLTAKSTNRTEEEAKTVPQNEEIERNGRRAGSWKKKLVTYFQKITC